MLSASDKLQAALRGDFTYYTRAVVYVQDQPIAELPIHGGEITIERDAEQRRRLSCELPALEEWIPADRGDLLIPKGTEIQVYAGVQFRDGTVEAPGVGRFRISRPKVQVSSSGEATISLDGYDRSRTVARARFTDMYVIPSGTNIGQAIEDLIVSRLGAFDNSLTFNLVTGSTTATLAFEPQDIDPWQACVKLAESDGLDIYFDGLGVPVLTPEPEPADDMVVWTFIQGEQGFGIVSADVELDEEESYNWVIATSNTTASGVAALRGEAFDTNPASPTYIGAADKSDPGFGRSEFGAVPYFLTSEYFTTQAQVDRAARAELQKVLGISERVVIECPPNPLLVPNDAAYIWLPDQRVDGRFIVDGIRLPLEVSGGTTMQVACRARRVVL